VVPSTGRPRGDFRFKLTWQAQEAIEPVEGDMRNMAHVSGPANLHGAEVTSPLTLASNQRFPQKGHKNGQQRQLLLRPVCDPARLTVGHRSKPLHRRRRGRRRFLLGGDMQNAVRGRGGRRRRRREMEHLGHGSH